MTETSVNRNERYKETTIHSKLFSHFQNLCHDPTSLAVNIFLTLLKQNNLYSYYGIAEALFSMEARKVHHLHLENIASQMNTSQPVL